MTLTDLVISLNGRHIIGKDSKRYVVEIPSTNTIGTISVFDAQDRLCHGFIPDLRDLRDTLYQAGVAEFMRVSNQCCLDMWAIDFRNAPLDYANKQRWIRNEERSDSLHIACPADYFVSNIKEELYELFGYWGEKRIIEPICGEVEQDILGTAQGVWFANDAAKDVGEDSHLALVHDNINPAIAVFSIGRSITDIPSGLYTFTPKTEGLINTDFNLVKEGEIYCYEAPYRFDKEQEFTIILELTTKLKIEKREQKTCGNPPWNFNNPTLFER